MRAAEWRAEQNWAKCQESVPKPQALNPKRLNPASVYAAKPSTCILRAFQEGPEFRRGVGGEDFARIGLRDETD